MFGADTRRMGRCWDLARCDLRVTNSTGLSTTLVELAIFQSVIGIGRFGSYTSGFPRPDGTSYSIYRNAAVLYVTNDGESEITPM